MSGVSQSGVNIVYNPSKYLEFRGLSWTEKQVAKASGVPMSSIFMPADLKAMLEGGKSAGIERAYDKRKTYAK
jgi:hypothetical protein